MSEMRNFDSMHTPHGSQNLRHQGHVSRSGMSLDGGCKQMRGDPSLLETRNSSSSIPLIEYHLVDATNDPPMTARGISMFGRPPPPQQQQAQCSYRWNGTRPKGMTSSSNPHRNAEQQPLLVPTCQSQATSNSPLITNVASSSGKCESGGLANHIGSTTRPEVGPGQMAVTAASNMEDLDGIQGVFVEQAEEYDLIIF